MLERIKLRLLRLKSYRKLGFYWLMIIALSAILCVMVYMKFSHRNENILKAEKVRQLVVFDLETRSQVPASSIIKAPVKPVEAPVAKKPASIKPAEIGFIISLPNSDRNIVEKAITLPAQFIISFSPSSDQSLELSKMAKDAGHDTVLELPIAGSKDTWGNLNLSVENTDFKNQKNLEAALSKVFEPSAVLMPGGEKFSESANFTPVLKTLAKDKLYLISESDDDAIDQKIKDTEVSLLKIDAVLDKPDDLEKQFPVLEDLAQKYGFVLVLFNSPSAENIDALQKWQAGLALKNIKLTTSH